MTTPVKATFLSFEKRVDCFETLESLPLISLSMVIVSLTWALELYHVLAFCGPVVCSVWEICPCDQELSLSRL